MCARTRVSGLVHVQMMYRPTSASDAPSSTVFAVISVLSFASLDTEPALTAEMRASTCSIRCSSHAESSGLSLKHGLLSFACTSQKPLASVHSRVYIYSSQLGMFLSRQRVEVEQEEPGQREERQMSCDNTMNRARSTDEEIRRCLRRPPWRTDTSGEPFVRVFWARRRRELHAVVRLLADNVQSRLKDHGTLHHATPTRIDTSDCQR